MKKFREWMHGKGRNVIIFMVLLLALWIVFDFFFMEKDRYLETDNPNPTVSPKTPEEEYIGGDSIGPAPEDTGTPDVTASPESGAEEKSAELPADTGKNQSIYLGFAGDICLDDTSAVMRHMRKKGGISKVISPELIRRMNGFDAMVINHEFSLSSRGEKMPGKAYTFRAKPENVKYLHKLGVDVAGLANNHVFDYGEAAFFDTLKYLKGAGIATVGAGENGKEARKPAYIKCRGKRIAIVAATRAEKNIMTPEAGKNSPGVFRTYDDSAYVRAIRRAKKKADFVITYVHWGTEYSTKLEDAQTEQAKDYINAGADLVIGAHTHCMQGVGYYKGVPIIYSLGNFWFNEKTLYTTLLEVEIPEKGDMRVRMIPCLQKGKETRILKKKYQKKKFVSYINDISNSGKLNEDCYLQKK